MPITSLVSTPYESIASTIHPRNGDEHGFLHVNPEACSWTTSSPSRSRDDDVFAHTSHHFSWGRDDKNAMPGLNGGTTKLFVLDIDDRVRNLHVYHKQ